MLYFETLQTWTLATYSLVDHDSSTVAPHTKGKKTCTCSPKMGLSSLSTHSVEPLNPNL
ncbi:hypothetical protein Pint_26981 [Pistacia integerrima]|uniref:Uncharacterized protein n=1 Tax=Pistacia integerrima TaxID=434235 RepID=A0ACC0YSS4_9ROSI|nr:hypothetical protein Pint_26981 [Pistacia integerrima]